MCEYSENSHQNSCGCISAKTTLRCRHFYSKEEQVAMLEAYKKQLENELLGVDQAIQELSK